MLIIRILYKYLTNHCQKGFAFKSKWYQDKGNFVVRISDTTDDSIDVSTCHRINYDLAHELKKYSLMSGDIVIATVGSWPPNFSSVVGKVIKVPIIADGALLNQNAVRLRSSESNLYFQTYLYQLLKTERFLQYIVNTAQGSANQASIKLTDIFNYTFVLPPTQLLLKFHEIVGSYEKLQDNICEENQSLIKIRDTLLPRLISGEVEVKEAEEGVRNVVLI